MVSSIIMDAPGNRCYKGKSFAATRLSVSLALLPLLTEPQFVLLEVVDFTYKVELLQGIALALDLTAVKALTWFAGQAVGQYSVSPWTLDRRLVMAMDWSTWESSWTGLTHTAGTFRRKHPPDVRDDPMLVKVHPLGFTLAVWLSYDTGSSFRM